jgi:head-tail adaptor
MSGMIGHLLTQTLSVYRSVDTVDSGGGRQQVFVQVSTVRAKVDQPTPAEVELAGVWGAQLSHVVRTEVYEDIRREDEFGGELPSEVLADQRLRVLAVVSDSHQTYRRMLCEITQAVDDTTGSSS